MSFLCHSTAWVVCMTVCGLCVCARACVLRVTGYGLEVAKHMSVCVLRSCVKYALETGRVPLVPFVAGAHWVDVQGTCLNSPNSLSTLGASSGLPHSCHSERRPAHGLLSLSLFFRVSVNFNVVRVRARPPASLL